MKNKNVGFVLTASFSLLTTISLSAAANNISAEQVIRDITYLASDKMQGRANFSTEIDQAANFISERFAQIGLKPLQGEASFKQTFSVTHILPTSLHATLNNVVIAENDVAMASTLPKLSWHDSKKIQTHVIAEQDNMRDVLRKINSDGGQHLVLISRAHAKTFAGYKGYFQQGITKLTLEHQGAIVMILTDEIDVTAIDITATATLSKKSLTNVVGILPGDDHKDEMVLYSSHYDHLGTTPDGKAVYNGADDDASGTTAVINLAEFYAKKGKNKRTLVFSAFTAEEIGGFGSQYFSKQLNPDDVVAMINIEMIGKPSKFGAGTMWMTGMERSNLGELLNTRLKSQNVEIYKDPYPEQGLFYRSDNATLARLGVPAHSFSSTQLDKDQHYHQVTDDIKSLDLDSMYQVIESLSVATQGLVDGTITPTRVDVNKVKASGKIY
ncbi:MAG: aminopeptidase YwaD [Alteromonadaceae bacterium]|jgi:aminopeptidase YwaD